MRIVLFFSILFGILSKQVTAQEVNTEKSLVSFSVRNMKMRTVEGTFTGLQGKLLLTNENKQNAQIQVCLDAKSINTANDKRDTHLRNDDFLAVDRFPSICFTSTSVQFLNENQVLAKGKLTLHGIIQEIEILLDKKENTWVGSFQINRLDFEIGKKYSNFMIGNVITLKVACFL